MHSFAIVVDSNCDLPPEYIKEHGIEVMPIPFILDGREHNQGYWQEISAKQYYDALRDGGVAKTSQINPESFEAVFFQYAEQGKDALFILLSGALSATYENAEFALQETKKAHPGCNIYVVDGMNASSGHGLLAMLAVQKREQGLSAGETAAWLESKRHSCIGLFTVDDLMYLHRGGRLSKFAAIAGSVLGIKPVLTIAPDGSLSLKEKVRGRKAAMELIISQLKQSLNPDTVMDTAMVSHTDCLEDAQMLADMIAAAVDVRQILITMTGPVIGAHLGPGSLTLVFEADITREQYERKFYGSM